MPIPKPFLDEENVKDDKLLRQVINMFSPLFTRKKYLEADEGFNIIFGQCTPQHGNVNFGVLTFWSDGSYYFEINGSYNVLQQEKFLGQYKTPILDEPTLEL